jgi:PucR C-terminal helix-turn-helix domain/GGDEF-like domain
VSSEPLPLRPIVAALTQAGVIPGAAAALGQNGQRVGRAFYDAVVSEIPAFSASRNPDILPELERHATAHVTEILRLFAGRELGDFGFVRTHAARLAEQRFPIEATLHSYRCGHRILSRWLREAAISLAPASMDQAISAVADFAIEYTNAASTIVASEYVARTRMLAEAEGDLRTELLTLLLNGYDESDGRVARLLKRAGYLEQHQSYCVVVAQSVNATEMENPARAQRVVNAIAETFASSGIRRLLGVRNNLVIGVFSDRRRQSGWTAPQADLAERIYPNLLALGPAVIVGVSADQPSTSFLPRALDEAMVALDFASVANRVVQFTNLPIRRLLVHGGAGNVRTAPPIWAQALVTADAKASGVLIQTLRAMADADMNVQKAARILRKHANTVYARLERIRELTGLDSQRYHDLTELLLAADLADVAPKGRQS